MFEEAALGDSEEETLQLFRLGMGVEQIATQRGLKTTTVYSHLSGGIERGEVELAEVVALAEHQLEAIRFAIEHHEGGKRLKPVCEALEGEFPYEVLRCVVADLQRE